MPPDPADVLTRLRRELDRTAFRARNGLKHVAGLDTARPGPTPRDQVWSRDRVRLHRYRPPSGTPSGEPLLLVMSLVTKPGVFDLLPGNSLVARLLDAGHDVFLLDWGTPDAVDAHNTLETYCDDYLPRAVDAVLARSTAAHVTLFGYCLGGVLALLAAAGHRALPLRRLVLLATPVDLTELGPLAALVRNERLDLDTLLDETGNVPASTMLQAFRMLDPTGDVTTYLSLWNSLTSPEQLAAHQALVGWSSDHIPFPGATFRQIAEMFVRDDALVRGRVPLGGRIVDLHRLAIPVLSVVGVRDGLVPPAASAPLPDVLTGTTVDRLDLPAGHAGLMLGRRAQRDFIPAILAWLADGSTERT